MSTQNYSISFKAGNTIKFNSVPTQNLFSPNQLKIENWNRILNQLSTQGNNLSNYLSSLDKWLFGSNDMSYTPNEPGDGFLHSLKILTETAHNNSIVDIKFGIYQDTLRIRAIKGDNETVINHTVSIDEEPTKNSPNLINSGGVKTYVDNAVHDLNAAVSGYLNEAKTELTESYTDADNKIKEIIEDNKKNFNDTIDNISLDKIILHYQTGLDSINNVKSYVAVKLNNSGDAVLERYDGSTSHSRISNLVSKEVLDTELSKINSIEYHICKSGEYDEATLIPTLHNPKEHTFYLVPSSDEEGRNLFVEWHYIKIDDSYQWETFGTASIDIANELSLYIIPNKGIANSTTYLQNITIGGVDYYLPSAELKFRDEHHEDFVNVLRELIINGDVWSIPEVVANVSTDDDTDSLVSLSINGKPYKIVGSSTEEGGNTGTGTIVIGNPGTTNNDPLLTSIKIDNTNYKVTYDDVVAINAYSLPTLNAPITVELDQSNYDKLVDKDKTLLKIHYYKDVADSSNHEYINSCIYIKKNDYTYTGSGYYLDGDAAKECTVNVDINTDTLSCTVSMVPELVTTVGSSAIIDVETLPQVYEPESAYFYNSSFGKNNIGGDNIIIITVDSLPDTAEDFSISYTFYYNRGDETIYAYIDGTWVNDALMFGDAFGGWVEDESLATDSNLLYFIRIPETQADPNINPNVFYRLNNYVYSVIFNGELVPSTDIQTLDSFPGTAMHANTFILRNGGDPELYCYYDRWYTFSEFYNSTPGLLPDGVIVTNGGVIDSVEDAVESTTYYFIKEPETKQTDLYYYDGKKFILTTKKEIKEVQVFNLSITSDTGILTDEQMDILFDNDVSYVILYVGDGNKYVLQKAYHEDYAFKDDGIDTVSYSSIYKNRKENTYYCAELNIYNATDNSYEFVNKQINVLGLAIDDTPILNSENLIYSGGVKQYVDNAIASVPTGGTTVEANPEVTDTNTDLTSIKIGDTSYKIPEGGDNFVTIDATSVNVNLGASFEIDLNDTDYDNLLNNNYYIKLNVVYDSAPITLSLKKVIDTASGSQLQFVSFGSMFYDFTDVSIMCKIDSDKSAKCTLYPMFDVYPVDYDLDVTDTAITLQKTEDANTMNRGTVTIDQTPTTDSKNLINSGGVKSYVDNAIANVSDNEIPIVDIGIPLTTLTTGTSEGSIDQTKYDTLLNEQITFVRAIIPYSDTVNWYVYAQKSYNVAGELEFRNLITVYGFGGLDGQYIVRITINSDYSYTAKCVRIATKEYVDNSISNIQTGTTVIANPVAPSADAVSLENIRINGTDYKIPVGSNTVDTVVLNGTTDTYNSDTANSIIDNVNAGKTVILYNSAGPMYHRTYVIDFKEVTDVITFGDGYKWDRSNGVSIAPSTPTTIVTGSTDTFNLDVYNNIVTAISNGHSVFLYTSSSVYTSVDVVDTSSKIIKFSDGYVWYKETGNATLESVEYASNNDIYTMLNGLEFTNKPVDLAGLKYFWEQIQTQISPTSAVTYVVGNPTEFTLNAGSWDGSTYVLSVTGKSIGTNGLQIGLMSDSSVVNTQAVNDAGLVLYYSSSSTNSDTGVTTTTIKIVANVTPTTDITIAIFGLE